MQIIGPLLVILLIGLVVLVIAAARRQRADLSGQFAAAARSAGLAWLAPDDGTAQSLAAGFDPDEFARFRAPSGGAAVPGNVVHGAVPEGYACLFSHATRRDSGDARHWFVAIVEAPETLYRGGLIKCRSRAVRRAGEVGGMAELEMPADPGFAAAFVVQAEDVAAARAFLDDRVRRTLMAAAAGLDCAVDIQIAGARVAVYPAARNYSPASGEDLAGLIAAARRVAHDVDDHRA